MRDQIGPAARRLIGGAAGVLALTTVGSALIRAISSLILTRLLDPSVFGLVGIISSLFFTFALLTDLGFESYIVRHANSEQSHFRDVLWTLHAFRGLLQAAAAILLAPLLSMLLDKPALTAPLIVASTTFAIGGFTSFSLIVALRAGAARKLSVLDFALTAFQSAVGIALAELFRNVWAIVSAMIVQSGARLVLSYTMFADAPHRFARDRSIRRDFYTFSRVVLLSSFLNLLVLQSDKLFLARFLGLAQFGMYSIALNLVSLPSSFANAYVARVIYPLYSRQWNADASRIASVYYSARQRVSVLFGLGTGTLIGSAPVLVSFLYDLRYRGAGVYVSLLAIGAGLRLPTYAAAEVMTAIGNIAVTLRANAIRVCWLATAGPLGFLIDGGTGVIGAVGLLELPILVYSWLVLRSAQILRMRYEIAYLMVMLVGFLFGRWGSSTVASLIHAWWR